MILEEFDPAKTAVFNPENCVSKIDDFPEVAVSCFSHVTLNRLLDIFEIKKIAEITPCNVTIPVYEIEYKGRKIALFNAYMGAAGCVATLEDLFVMGVKKLVIFGTCGVLDNSINDCAIIIPDSAVRDEGTSYHYRSSSEEIAVNEKYIDEFKKFLDDIHVSYHTGKVWTTDGIYRETRDKVIRRKEQGCICVDMECSAVAALAEFRNRDVLHFFYGADNLDAEEWDQRSLDNNDMIDEKHKIACIALEMALRI